MVRPMTLSHPLRVSVYSRPLSWWDFVPAHNCHCIRATTSQATQLTVSHVTFGSDLGT